MEEGTSDAKMRVRDTVMDRLSVGHMHDMRSIVKELFLPMWRFRGNTLPEKVNTWRGPKWFGPVFREELIRDDLCARLRKFELHVYVLSGRHDDTANADLARAYFDAIKAPVKAYYLFGSSVHSPPFEEPGRATETLLHDVMQGAATLADVMGTGAGE